VKSKLILVPQVNFFNDGNEKTHVGTWVALEQILCRRNSMTSYESWKKLHH